MIQDKAPDKGTTDGPYLKIFGPEDGRSEVALPQEKVYVGRGEDCAIYLSHKTVSRKHAAITYADGQYTIEDQGSNVGLTVNGERIESQVLSAGDTIEISHYVLQFQARSAGASAASAAEKAGRLLKGEFRVLPDGMGL